MWGRMNQWDQISHITAQPFDVIQPASTKGPGFSKKPGTEKIIQVIKSSHTFYPNECCLLKLSQHLAAFFGFFLHILLENRIKPVLFLSVGVSVMKLMSADYVRGTRLSNTKCHVSCLLKITLRSKLFLPRPDTTMGPWHQSRRWEMPYVPATWLSSLATLHNRPFLYPT